jgi:Rps23 Pro-64 3,4-dihydroxylase Tpa1-like proline 4-hydroxylase
MAPALLKESGDPFAHFVLSDFYEPEFADTLSQWLSSEASWHRAVHHFYDQFELNFKDTPSVPKGIYSALLSLPALRRVKALAEEFFEMEFHPNVALGAHKLVDGQSIGVHTDNAPEAETHRIVVQLSRDWKDEYGGHLVFLGSAEVGDVKSIFRHVFNTAIGFSLNRMSYHAVAAVSRGQRLTVIYGFWSISSEFSEANAERTFAIS